MVSAERTCDGRCCAVFPLSWNVEGPNGIATWYDEKHPDSDRSVIADMLVSLTPFEARQRWADLGYGDFFESNHELAYSPQPLYTCRHWDTTTRLCTIYERRPKHLCGDFPYGRSCHHKGCDYRQPISFFVGEAAREWDELKPYGSES